MEILEVLQPLLEWLRGSLWRKLLTAGLVIAATTTGLVAILVWIPECEPGAVLVRSISGQLVCVSQSRSKK